MAGTVYKRLSRLIDPVFRRADIALTRRSRLNELQGKLDEVYDNCAIPSPAPPLPPEAEELLRPDHPTLAEYESRYDGHPAADSSQWNSDYVRNTIDMKFFRANSSYVWQQWDFADPFRYGLATYYTRLHDRLRLFDRLHEDGAFRGGDV